MTILKSEFPSVSGTNHYFTNISEERLESLSDSLISECKISARFSRYGQETNIARNYFNERSDETSNFSSPAIQGIMFTLSKKNTII